MRILLWAPLGAGYHYWGPGTSAYRLYSANVKDDVEVTLVHASDSQALLPDVYVSQVKLGSLDGNSVFKKIIYLVRAFVFLATNYRKYDVMHCLGFYWDSFFPGLLFSLLGGKCLVKITGDNSGLQNNSAISRLLGISLLRNLSVNKFGGFIAISESIHQSLLKFGVAAKKIYRIPNGVSITRFNMIGEEERKRLREKYGIGNDFTFIFCGGVSERKRTLETVIAVAELRGKIDRRFKLLVVGPDRSESGLLSAIETYIRDNALEDIVYIIGSVENPEVYYQMSDVFILASRSEGMSNSLLEAMACGLPVIVTPVSGSTDLIEEGVQGIFTSGEPADISACMCRFIDGSIDNKKMGLLARQHVVSNYSYGRVWELHMSAFKSIKQD